MKEFEKHWKENGGGICGKAACEEYWRAALEWAMTLANAGGEIAYSELEEKVTCT